jgi:hypothetical protein
MSDRTNDRSLGELFSELARETRQLVRQEFELATTEVSGKAKKAAAGAVFQRTLDAARTLRESAWPLRLPNTVD